MDILRWLATTVDACAHLAGRPASSIFLGVEYAMARSPNDYRSPFLSGENTLTVTLNTRTAESYMLWPGSIIAYFDRDSVRL